MLTHFLQASGRTHTEHEVYTETTLNYFNLCQNPFRNQTAGYRESYMPLDLSRDVGKITGPRAKIVTAEEGD